MSRTSGRGAAAGAPSGRRPPVPRRRCVPERLADEWGAQALEFAMVLPAVTTVVALVVFAALAGVDAMVAQGLAREGARVAAIDGPEAAVAAVRAAAAGRPVEVDVLPPRRAAPGADLVHVRVRIPPRVPGGGTVARGLWLSAEAVMRVEQP